MTAFGSGADCLFLAPFCHCLACVIVYFPSSNHIDRVRQLIIRHIAVECGRLDGRMTKRGLNGPHANARGVQSCGKCPATRMGTGLDPSCFIDRFEAQAQADIAEMPPSACAANECPAIVQLGLRAEIGVDELPEFVADENTARFVPFGLVLAEIDDLYALAIKPAHIAQRQSSNLSDTHPSHDAQCQCRLVPEAVAARFSDHENPFDLLGCEHLCLCHLPVFHKEK